MSAPLEDRLEASIGALRAEFDKIEKLQAEMESRTSTATSKNRMVTATVDSTGVLTELKIKGNRYRDMAPAELAAVVVETVSSAQKQSRQAAMTAFTPLMPASFPTPDGNLGAGSLEEMFEAAKALIRTPVFDEPHAGPAPEEGA